MSRLAGAVVASMQFAAPLLGGRRPKGQVSRPLREGRIAHRSLQHSITGSSFALGLLLPTAEKCLINTQLDKNSHKMLYRPPTTIKRVQGDIQWRREESLTRPVISDPSVWDWWSVYWPWSHLPFTCRILCSNLARSGSDTAGHWHGRLEQIL